MARFERLRALRAATMELEASGVAAGAADGGASAAKGGEDGARD